MSNKGKYCSWCFHHTKHIPVSKSLLTRNACQCEHCGNDTCVCMSCSVAMARNYADHADKMCYQCKFLIPNWKERPAKLQESLKINARCSWCFAVTSHTMYRHNTATRSTYRCDSCNNSTVSCRKCTDMARNHQPIGDQFCALHAGTIKDWNKPYETGKLLLQEGWCSWCITMSIHELDTSNLIGRHYYRCLQCSNRTLNCVKCKQFSRGGFMWNDTLCAVCFREENSAEHTWKSLKQKRDAICLQGRNLERVKAELERRSDFREKALKQGVLRPFLLLVSMPAMLRNQISCQLGWSIFTKPYFGDAHAESYHILNDSNSGMQARANHSYERLNPLAHNCNWYDILVRVMQCLFESSVKNVGYSTSQPACCESGSALIQDTEVAFFVKLSKKMKAMMKKQKKGPTTFSKENSIASELESSSEKIEVPPLEKFPSDILRDYVPKEEPLPKEVIFKASTDEDSEKVEVTVSDTDRKVAMETLEGIQLSSELYHRRQKVATEILESESQPSTSEYDSLIEEQGEEDSVSEDFDTTDYKNIDESIVYIKKMMLKNTGIQREEVGEYAVKLGMTCAGISKLSVSIMCLKISAFAVPTVAGVALPAAAALSLLSTPMMVIGIISLATGAFKLGFGSSEGRLIQPVIAILNQRLLLALEDINIDDYY